MKKAIKRIVIILIVIVALPFVAYGLLLLTTPISRSDEAVRDYVFRQIPAGTSWEDAMELREESPSESRVVGTQAMFVRLGELYRPFHEAVFAYLAFDENGKLVEVAIRRDIDAL